MHNEVELKLLFQPKDLSKLLNLPAIRRLARGRKRTRLLPSVYYDTPELELRKQNISLRVRKEGRRYLQCVKSAGTLEGGVLVRGEWENPVPTEDPVIPAIEDEQLRRRVIACVGDRLEPVLRTEVERTSRRIVVDGGEIVMDVDTGAIVTAKGRQPISELELELKDGSPHHLCDLALEILPEVGLRLSTKSKAERGFALLTGEEPGWRKKTRLALPADSTVEEALISIARHCLAHMLENEACTLETENPEGVHQMRVALRRLRSALGLFRRMLPEDQYRWAVGEIKWLTGQMAPARDWDVFLAEIVAPVVNNFPDEAAFKTMIERIEDQRVSSRRAARRAIRSQRYTRFLLRISGWLGRRGWREQGLNEAAAHLFDPVADFSTALISATHGKVRKKGRHFAKLSAADRHRLRIKCKKLRYTVDFFSSLYPPKTVEPFTATLSKLQDDLGYLNDVSVAAELIERLAKSTRGEDAQSCRHAGGIVLGWHTHAVTKSESAYVADMAHFIDSKPFWP